MTTQAPPGYRASMIQMRGIALGGFLQRLHGTAKLPTADQLAALVTSHERAMAQARIDLRHAPAPMTDAERKRLLLARLDRATKGVIPHQSSTRTTKGKK